MTRELSNRLKALSDPRRLLIVQLLARNDLCVTALARRLGVSKAAASQHLKVLRQAGFVRGEKRGYWTHYVIDKKAFTEVINDVNEIVEGMRDGSCKQNCRNDCCYAVEEEC